MGPGPSLFSKFGHAAICVRYDGPSPDRCYNYGTTDFAKPVDLVWGVLRGNSVFWVSVDSPEHMIEQYVRRDRSVWRQTIPLPPDEARALAAKLAHAARPENREYSYHHFHDNCSTRVRDLINEATGGALSNDDPFNASYRELSQRGLAESTSLVAMSDVLLGRAADENPTVYEAMFLPAVLRVEVADKLGAEPHLIYARAESPPSAALDPSLRIWWWGLLAALVTGFALLARVLIRGRRLFLAAAFFPLGLMGLIIWLVAIVSPLVELRLNEALLVLVPMDLAVPFLRPRARQLYARGRIALLALVSLLVVVGIFSQPLLLPILAVVIPLLTLAC